MALVRKGAFTIPAAHVSRGGAAGIKQLRATGRAIETKAWEAGKPRNPVSKRGEWQTIEQRERKASRARRTQRRGMAAATLGGSAAVGAYAAGHGKGSSTPIGRRNKAWEEAGHILQGSKEGAKFYGMGHGGRALLALHGATKLPHGGALLGGGALAAAGGAGMAQGKVREKYHQSKINQRRRQRFGKRAPMDHEGSGFARYGNGSTKGKRLSDEFSKRDKRDREVKHGQRVKTFNGHKATIQRQDYTGAQRFGHYLNQATNIAAGTQSGFHTPAHRDAKAVADKWYRRTGISSATTDDKKATRLMLRDRSDASRHAQRGLQGVAGAGVGAGIGYAAAGGGATRVIHGSVPRITRNRVGAAVAAGAGIGGLLGVSVRPTDRRLSFERPVSKRIRNKDAEDDRQRRLGMGVAATGLGSALLLRRGIGGAVKTTKAVRRAKVPTGFNDLPQEGRDFFRHAKTEDGRLTNRTGIALRHKDVGYTAAGAASGGAALGLEHYSRSRRNRRWE